MQQCIILMKKKKVWECKISNVKERLYMEYIWKLLIGSSKDDSRKEAFLKYINQLWYYAISYETIVHYIILLIYGVYRFI